LYFADSPETAWAEFYRAISEYGLPPSRAMPRRLAEVSVEVSGIADLSDPKKLEAAGLPATSPSTLNWPPFQAVGEALFAEGVRGLIAPSAARERGKVLCLFRPASEIEGLEVTGIHEVKDLPEIPQGLRT
jgi:RES domain-containing protein